MTELSFNSISDCSPPQNIEAEERILGGILLDPGAIYRVGDTLPAEAFTIEAHRKIYRAALSLHRKRKPTDLMSTCNWLVDHKQLESIGGQAKLAQLVNCTVSTVNIGALADLVLKKYLRRCAAQLGTEIVHLAYESLADDETVFNTIQEKVLSLTRSYQNSDQDDHDQWEHDEIIKQVAAVELLDNASLRYLKFTKIAKKFGLNINQLETLYFKSLLNDENEPALSLAEYRDKYSASVLHWLLAGFLASGKTSLIYGKGGVGKTRLIYDWIYALANGESWNGFPVTAKRRKVLLIQTDESPSDTLQALEARGFTDEMPVLIKARWTVDHLQQLDKEIEKHQPDWVIIDSYTSVSINSIYSENEVPYARPILKAKTLAEKHGCHISFVHHANADGNPRGTSAILNAVSDVFCIAKDGQNPQPDSLQRLLRIEKSRSRAPGVYELLYNPDDNSWSCLGKQGESEGPSNPLLSIKDRIVDFLHRHRNTVFEAVEIHSEIGGQLESVRRSASQLAKDGLIACKRLPSKANGYWIGLDGDRLPDHISPDREAINKVKAQLRASAEQVTDDASGMTVLGNPKVIHLSDHRRDGSPVDHLSGSPLNPPFHEDAAICDHPIHSSADLNTHVITLNEDRMIADSPNPIESVPQGRSTQAIHERSTPDPVDRMQSSLTIPSPDTAEAEALAECPFKPGDYVKEREGDRCGWVEEVRTIKKGSPKEPFHHLLVTVEGLTGATFETDPFYLEASPPDPSTKFACLLTDRPKLSVGDRVRLISTKSTGVVFSIEEENGYIVLMDGKEKKHLFFTEDSLEPVPAVETTETGHDLELHSRSIRSAAFKQVLANASAEEIRRVIKWSTRDGDTKRVEALQKQLDQLGVSHADGT